MSQNDIDKIFRDELSDYEADITPSDWNAFEEQLPNRKKPGFLLILFGILLIATVGVGVWTNIASTRSTGNQTGENKITTPTDNNSSHSDNPNSSKIHHPSSPKENPVEKSNQENPFPSESLENQENPEELLNTSNKEKSGESVIVEVNPSNVKTKKSETTFSPILSEDSNLENNHIPATGKNIDPTSEKPVEVSQDTELLVFQPDFMTMKPIGFEPFSSSLELKNRESSIKKSRNRYISIFGNYFYSETLNSSYGFGANYNFRKNKIIISAGVGYQRFGNLNWNQSNTIVSYGFNRYEIENTLHTQTLEMLYVPIRAAYYIYPRVSVFGGVDIGQIIHSKQIESANSVSGENPGSHNSGYLYKTDSPTTPVFISMGGTYYINERTTLDIGGRYGLQDWSPGNESPMGISIQLNYKPFREW